MAKLYPNYIYHDFSHNLTNLCLPIVGLTLEESTDIPTLQRELNKVDHQIKELSTSKRSKFTDRQNKEELKVLILRQSINLEILKKNCLATSNRILLMY